MNPIYIHHYNQLNETYTLINLNLIFQTPPAKHKGKCKSKARDSHLLHQSLAVPQEQLKEQVEVPTHFDTLSAFPLQQLGPMNPGLKS